MTWISETASLIKTPCTVLVMEKNMAKYNQIIETNLKFSMTISHSSDLNKWNGQCDKNSVYRTRDRKECDKE